MWHLWTQGLHSQSFTETIPSSPLTPFPNVPGGTVSLPSYLPPPVKTLSHHSYPPHCSLKRISLKHKYCPILLLTWLLHHLLISARKVRHNMRLPQIWGFSIFLPHYVPLLPSPFISHIYAPNVWNGLQPSWCSMLFPISGFFACALCPGDLPRPPGEILLPLVRSLVSCAIQCLTLVCPDRMACNYLPTWRKQ